MYVFVWHALQDIGFDALINGPYPFVSFMTRLFFVELRPWTILNQLGTETLYYDGRFLRAKNATYIADKAYKEFAEKVTVKRPLRKRCTNQCHNTWVFHSDSDCCPQPENDFLNFWLPWNIREQSWALLSVWLLWQHVLYKKMSFGRRSLRWPVATLSPSSSHVTI